MSRGVEGRVVISLTLDNAGRVVKAEPLESDTDEDLRRAAVKGVIRASPFAPPQLALGESTITAQVPILFRLINTGTMPN
jgi:TonB family protein